ncbi:MAG TPA: DUF1499 domain-containing protein [Hyphomicrobiaceae bacterium]|nr:DUF1499 domain-containing protein [Hyphomicrobiaceae bacterium]
MTLAKVEGAPALARWTGRIALFSLVVAVVAIIGHRLFGMATPVLMSLLLVAFAGAMLGLVLALFASVPIWRNGGTGAARIVIAIVIGLGMIAWPLSFYPQLKRLPTLNDVTTDTADPPAFVVLTSVRTGTAANGITYNRVFAQRQHKAYPDIQPMLVNRSVEETFDLVVNAVRRMRMRIVSETPPDEQNGMGTLEAVDRTLIMGFRDDVAVRVTGSTVSSRVDIRSASRYGRHDLGRNVKRVRDLMREIVVMLESTIPGAAENRRKHRRNDAKPSARKGADRKKEAPRR